MGRGLVLNSQSLGLSQDSILAVAQTTTLSNSSSPTDGGGTLMMSDATLAASVALLSNYIASSFVVGGLSHGATAITDATPIAAAQTTFLSQPLHT